MIFTEIEDTNHSLKELSTESDPEIKKEQNDRSLTVAIKEIESRSKPKIEEDEHIIHSLEEPAIESDPEIKKEEDGRSLTVAIKEIESRSKPKIEEDKHIMIHCLEELAKESDPEIKKEQDERSLTVAIKEIKSRSKPEIEEDEHIMIHSVKELAIESDPKIQKEEQNADQEIESRSKPKIEEQNADHDTEKEDTDPSESGLETIEVLERIVFGYEKFIDYTLKILKDSVKKSEELEEHRWRDLLKRRQRVTESLNLGIKKVNDELEHLKEDENETEEGYYDKSPYIRKLFRKLKKMNATLNQCLNFDDIKSEKGLELCVKKLDRCKEQMNDWICIIRIRKANVMDTSKSGLMKMKMEALAAWESSKI